jgi:hypothetical protein
MILDPILFVYRKEISRHRTFALSVQEIMPVPTQVGGVGGMGDTEIGTAPSSARATPNISQYDTILKYVNQTAREGA